MLFGNHLQQTAHLVATDGLSHWRATPVTAADKEIHPLKESGTRKQGTPRRGCGEHLRLPLHRHRRPVLRSPQTGPHKFTDPRVLRCIEHRRHIAILNQPSPGFAAAQERDAVGEALGQGHFMRYHDHQSRRRQVANNGFHPQ